MSELYILIIDDSIRFNMNFIYLSLMIVYRYVYECVCICECEYVSVFVCVCTICTDYYVHIVYTACAMYIYSVNNGFAIVDHSL